MHLSAVCAFSLLTLRPLYALSDKVTEKSKPQFLHERASTLVEYQSLIEMVPCLERIVVPNPKYIHVLKPADPTTAQKGGQWGGRIRGLKDHINKEATKVKADVAQVKTDVAQVKTEVAQVKAEVAGIKAEVAGINAKLDAVLAAVQR